MRTIEVSDRFLVEAAQLIYGKWAAEFDLLKQVKAEKNDGSMDWELLHAERLRRHTETEAAWSNLMREGATLLREAMPDVIK